MDEMARAAAEGDVPKLKKLLDKKNPRGKQVQEAVVAAAGKVQFEAMKALMLFGASPLSRDQRDAKAFIVACGAGSLEMVELMIKHEADVNDSDKFNRTPMSAAIAGPHLDIVKALILAGAQAPEECSVRGVGQAIWEAKLDMMTKQMKHYSEIHVNPPELEDAEEKVWIAMREHMRLLEQREEKNAGDQLAKTQQLAKSENDEARKSEAKVDRLTEDLRTVRVRIEKENSMLRDLVSETRDVKQKHAVLEDEDLQIRTEIMERQKELEEAQGASRASHEALRSMNSNASELTAEARVLQDEISKETARKKLLSEKLQTSEAELAGWLRDKETAAELTAQAHKLLGH